MSKRPSPVASQNGWVSASGWGRSKRIAVTGSRTFGWRVGASSMRRERGYRDATQFGLTRLVRDPALEVDSVLVALFVLLGHGDARREDFAGPGLFGEADLVGAEVADAHIIGERLAQKSGGKHAVP